MHYPHQPVLLGEAVGYLVTVLDGLYVDGTVGSGGHSLAIGGRITPRGRLLCLDRDPEAVKISKKRLRPLGETVSVKQANYAALEAVLRDQGLAQADGILLDLGLSSFQLEASGRGFSFQREEPLDMRMDPRSALTAYSLVNDLPFEELKRILKEYGEVRGSSVAARSIMKARKKGPIRTSLELAELIGAAMPRSRSKTGKHPATQTFQALRIAVNRELAHLRVFLDQAPALIKTGGRLVILSYHSLEDRMVKQAMLGWEKGCTCPKDFPACVCGQRPLFKRLHKKGIRPSQQEIEINPRARSATLRAAERI